MNRRGFLKTGVVVGTVLSTPGCSGVLGSGESEEVDPTEKSFQYFFQDETGTLGHVAENNQPPEDAEDWQIIENTLEEEDWEQKQDNDVEAARNWLQGDVERLPSHGPVEGTVEDMVRRTQEIYESPDSYGNDGKGDQMLRDLLLNDDDPERFTRALVIATNEETGIKSSGGADAIVPNVAEYAMEELGLDFPKYQLSTSLAAEPINGNLDNAIEESIREREDGSTVGIDDMNHLMSILTYEKDGELELKYVENVGTGQHPTVFQKQIRDPEDSLYRTEIGGGTFEVDSDEMWPEHYVTAFDYHKARQMENMGLLEPGTIGRPIVHAAIHAIDDGKNDRRDSQVNQGWPVEVSDSFGRSVEDYALNPTVEKKRQFKNFGRAVYSIYETKFGEDYKGTTITGYSQPLRIEGTLENPELYHDPCKQSLPSCS